MQLTEDDVAQAQRRFHQLSEHAKDQLDPICESVRGVDDIIQPVDRKGIRAVPNRIYALLAHELYEQWNRLMLERE
jgi:hypothetical protein